MWWLVLIALLLFTLLYFKLAKTYKHWDDKGIIYEKPVPILGMMTSTLFRTKTVHKMITDLYQKYSDHRYVGVYMFTEPALLIRDLDLIKQIVVKDFDVFPDHKTFVPLDVDPLWAKNLFQMSVKDGWHSMRSTLSPSFTSSKMKIIFELMQDCSKNFIAHFKNQNKSVPVDVKAAFTKFANDVIGTSAFGISCDSLKYPNNEFYLMGKEATDVSGFRIFKFFISSLSPMIMKLFRIKILNSRTSNFFKKIIKDTLDYRREKGIVRPDMIHLMLEAQKAQDNNETNKQRTQLTDASMTSQALIFFSAGFETVSSALSFLAYELVANPDVQQKLYEEIQQTLTDGKKATYDSIFAMKYLDCVVSESLRLHTPVPILDRKSVKPYTIQPVLPSEKPLNLDEGTVIFIPAAALHQNEQYFPNPNKFDPERFNTENKANIVPYTYLPFGTGPRNCIGNRFALMEVKLIIVELLQQFEIIPNEKTQIPLKLSKSNFSTIPEEGIWMSFKPRIVE